MRVVGDPAGIRAARRFVEQQVVVRGGATIADDAALVAGELLANAVQHGAPPIEVEVTTNGELIRLEVRDGHHRPPVRPAASQSNNMTGRGLSMIEAASTRWGVEPLPGIGKVVWAEFDPARSRTATAPAGGPALSDWQEPLPAGTEPRYTVVLGDVSTDLLIDAKAHIDNLVREFSLMAAGGGPGDVPSRDLAEMIRSVVVDFGEARDSIKRQALAAAQRGAPRTDLVLRLPAGAVGAAEAYLGALDEADAYARAARLLTLEAPPVHRLFRHWYVDGVIRQLRAQIAGDRPEPVQPFEQVMLNEIQRLATLQRITDRAARLQRVTAALAGARTPEDVAAVVISEGVSALDAAGGGLLVPAEDRVHIAVPGAVGYGDELVGALREERLDAPLPAATVLRTGEPVWLESREERDRQFPALRGFEAATVSMCSVPLVAGEQILGALRFSFSSRRLFDEDERAFVLALATQTAQTLLRTENYAAERKASLELQRALLPAETPAIPGWQTAAYYSPAGDQEAGGDFYDILPLDDRRVVAVVGDVMGRGIEAAAAMAQVRTMIRAYAVDDPSPTSVFTKVDTFFNVAGITQFVTVLYALIDPHSGELLIGNAGHLQPIVSGAYGASLADVAAGAPLGVGDEARTATPLFLAPGESIFVVTDGLVERRGEDIDVGIQRVLDAAERNRGEDPQTVIDRLLEASGAGGVHDDDVTLLALRRCRPNDAG